MPESLKSLDEKGFLQEVSRFLQTSPYLELADKVNKTFSSKNNNKEPLDYISLPDKLKKVPMLFGKVVGEIGKLFNQSQPLRLEVELENERSGSGDIGVIPSLVSANNASLNYYKDFWKDTHLLSHQGLTLSFVESDSPERAIQGISQLVLKDSNQPLIQIREVSLEGAEKHPFETFYDKLFSSKTLKAEDNQFSIAVGSPEIQIPGIKNPISYQKVLDLKTIVESLTAQRLTY